MDREEAGQLLKAFGWEPWPKPVDFPYMVSFGHTEKKARLNLYFTTGTFTIQGDDINVRVRNATLAQLEKAIS